MYNETYLGGMRVIVAEQTYKIRNKTSKIKFIDKLFEKIYGYSEVKGSYMPEGKEAFIIDDVDGSKILVVRDRETLYKISAAISRKVMGDLEGGER
jgi:hypothetical protein